MVSVYVTRALLGLVMVLLAKGIADTLLSHCTTAADVRRFAFYQVLALAVLGGIGYYFVTNWQY